MSVHSFVWENESQVTTSLEKLRTHDLNWLLFGYDTSETGPLHLTSSGVGGLGAGLPLLSTDKVHYIFIGIKPENEKTSGADFTQTKFILITWVGPCCE